MPFPPLFRVSFSSSRRVRRGTALRGEIAALDWLARFLDRGLRAIHQHPLARRLGETDEQLVGACVVKRADVDVRIALQHRVEQPPFDFIGMKVAAMQHTEND